MTGRVNRLPVVDDGGRMVGIVSRIDVLGVFDRPDNDIRDEVTKKILVGDFGLDPGAFDVTVRSGIVTITGLVGSRHRGSPDWRATACGGRRRRAGQAQLSPGGPARPSNATDTSGIALSWASGAVWCGSPTAAILAG